MNKQQLASKIWKSPNKMNLKDEFDMKEINELKAILNGGNYGK